MRKTILYLSHMDWDWIRQRPQYLACGLAEHYEISVVYKTDRHKSGWRENPSDGLEVTGLYTMPYHKIRQVYPIYRAYCRLALARTIRKTRPDILWVTHPEMFGLLPTSYRGYLVYDCMDDAQEFTHGQDWEMSYYLTQEKQLLARAQRIFVSSEHLARRIDEREPCRARSLLVRNAFGGRILESGELRPSERAGPPHKITYFGTIAPWFDFASLRRCLNEIAEIEFEIIGPSHGVDASAFAAERLRFIGPVGHDELPSRVAESACLIMPFEVNELIRSVDPVKLYEYINLNKPIVSVEYDEIRRFEPFVHFYRSTEELVEVLRLLIADGFARKYTDHQRMAFLTENTWRSRIDTIRAAFKEDGL